MNPMHWLMDEIERRQVRARLDADLQALVTRALVNHDVAVVARFRDQLDRLPTHLGPRP